MRIKYSPIKLIFHVGLLCLSLGIQAGTHSDAGTGINPKVSINTNLGNILVELDALHAPKTVANFLAQMDKGAYSGVVFHRVIAGFMIQSGGYGPDLKDREPGQAIVSSGSVRSGIINEADNGLQNVIGTIAMARNDEIDSAYLQFFINTEDNDRLDHSDASCTREDEKKQMRAAAKGLYRPLSCKTFGYAVFGHVIGGMNVVRKIEAVPTIVVEDFDDMPAEPIVIQSVSRIDSKTNEVVQ